LQQILSELNILWAALIIIFPVQTLQISTKSTVQFWSNSCLKNGAQKQGRVAIVVAPWIDPFFMERSLKQHFGQQERSIFLDRSETSLHPSQSRDEDRVLVGVAYEVGFNVKFYR